MPGNSSYFSSSPALFSLLELPLSWVLAPNVSKPLPSCLSPSTGEFLSRRVSVPVWLTYTEIVCAFAFIPFVLSTAALFLLLEQSFV